MSKREVEFLKRSEFHFWSVIATSITSFFTFIWIPVTLADKSLAANLTVGLLVLFSWIGSGIVWYYQWMSVKDEREKQLTLFTIIAAPFIISVFTNLDLYKKSGSSKKETIRAIEQWERVNIETFVELFKKGHEGKKLSKGAEGQILNIEKLYKEKVINIYSKQNFIKKLILSDIKIDNLPVIFKEEELWKLISK